MEIISGEGKAGYSLYECADCHQAAFWPDPCLPWETWEIRAAEALALHKPGCSAVDDFRECLAALKPEAGREESLSN